MNIDTDLQFAFCEGIRDYMTQNIDYLKTQIGNPDGQDLPNKKYYDPRKWLREGEATFKTRLKQAFEDLKQRKYFIIHFTTPKMKVAILQF